MAIRKALFRKPVNTTLKIKNKLFTENRKTQIVGIDGLIKSLGGGPTHEQLSNAIDSQKNAMTKRKRGVRGLIRRTLSPRAVTRLSRQKRTIVNERATEKKFRQKVIERHPELANKIKTLFGNIKKYDKITLESKRGNEYSGTFDGLMTDRTGKPIIIIKQNGKSFQLNLRRIEYCTKH
jgi:hypothetical protein